MVDEKHARARLRQQYVASFPEKIGVLEVAQRRLRNGDAGADAQLRALAHRLAGSGGTYGFEQLGEVASQTQHAEPSELDDKVTLLIQLLAHGYATGARNGSVVLLVDDDPDAVDLMVAKLADLQAAIHVASSASEALTLHRQINPDIVVLDLLLPDGHGFELLKQMGAGIHASHTPVVVVTVVNDTEVKRECLRLGAEHVIEKATDLDILHTAVSTVLEKRRKVSESSRGDPLTGLLNRAGFYEELQRAKSLAGRTQMRYSLALIDLDHFKDVNDIYGHAMGDRVLQRFAEILRTRLRASDVAARWGGEEFIVLLPNTPTAGGVIALEHVSDALRKEVFCEQASRLEGVTFSGGIVDFDDNVEIEELIASADQLLYAAKAAGRDRVLDAPPCDASKRRTALLIEDDDDAAAMIRTLLTEQNVLTRRFKDGREALNKLFDEPFDLVVLDIMLPGVSGLDILRAIREEPRLRRVPVVMLTALNSELHLETSFDHGADDYVNKPFRPRELSARLRRLLNRSEPPASLPAGVRVSSRPPR